MNSKIVSTVVLAGLLVAASFSNASAQSQFGMIGNYGFYSKAPTQTVNAFNSFHVRVPIDPADNPYNCVIESYGAVVNTCAYNTTLTFDLPVQHAIVHTLQVQNYADGTGPTGSTCTVWSFDGNGKGRAGTINLQFMAMARRPLRSRVRHSATASRWIAPYPLVRAFGAISWNP